MGDQQDAGVLADKLRERGFKVVTPLKGNGHASVFRVKESDDPAAIAYVAKVVSLTGLDAKGRASAQQEVSLLKGLARHDNLIAYRESFTVEADLLYMVMSLAEDGDLRRVVTEFQAAKRLIPEPVVLTWVRQTLSGLKHLHGQGVVHRDLKSSNIFLCEGRRRIRIGDFGISRILDSTAWATSVVGTPAYMSPELMRNERYDYHVDMWALGCICFELCTLNLPFTARSLFELACQVMEQSPAWALWDGYYTEELRDVAERLLNKSVDDRPTASEMMLEPLFVPGGRATLEPPAEVWASMAPAEVLRSPEKRIQQPPMSQLTTAVNSSNSGNWTMTPCKPAREHRHWESVSQVSDSVDSASPGGAGSSTDTGLSAEPFTRELQRAREEQNICSKGGHAQSVSTHSEQLLLPGLSAVGNSGADQRTAEAVHQVDVSAG